MFSNEASISTVKQYLERSRNPYAKLGVFDEDDYKREQVYNMGNPYASVDSEASQKKMSFPQISERTGLTKPEFNREVRSIFESYSPLFKTKIKMSSERRKWIKMASDLSAEKRLKIFKEFEKFRLDNIENYEPMLNREARDGDDELIEKFKSIIQKHV